jgi:hypothetical protein
MKSVIAIVLILGFLALISQAKVKPTNYSEGVSIMCEIYVEVNNGNR